MSIDPPKKDIYIKDQGDFITIIFESEKALEAAQANVNIDQYLRHENKLNIAKYQLSILLNWANDKGLTIDSEL